MLNVKLNVHFNNVLYMLNKRTITNPHQIQRLPRKKEKEKKKTLR